MPAGRGGGLFQFIRLARRQHHANNELREGGHRWCICRAPWATGLFSGAVAAGEFDGVTLRVGTWGGSWRKVQEDHIVPQLVAKGLTIEFVTASPHDNLAKLVAARGRDVPIDLMEVGEPLLPSIAEGNFAAKIDHDLVPNKANMPASLYEDDMFVTLTSQYGVLLREAEVRGQRHPGAADLPGSRAPQSQEETLVARHHRGPRFEQRGDGGLRSGRRYRQHQAGSRSDQADRSVHLLEARQRQRDAFGNRGHLRRDGARGLVRPHEERRSKRVDGLSQDHRRSHGCGDVHADDGGQRHQGSQGRNRLSQRVHRRGVPIPVGQEDGSRTRPTRNRHRPHAKRSRCCRR